MIVNKKTFWIFAIAVLILYSIVYVNFPNPFGQLIQEMSSKEEITKTFFNSVFATYNNVILQFAFRVLTLIVNIWIVITTTRLIANLESSIRRETKVDFKIINDFAYNLAFVTLITFAVLAITTIFLGKALPMISLNNYTLLLAIMLLGKIFIAYIPLIKKCKLYLTACLGIITSASLIFSGALLK